MSEFSSQHFHSTNLLHVVVFVGVAVIRGPASRRIVRARRSLSRR
jgi:hypothetical protein